VGFDDKTSLGENETGARAGLLVWVSFMRQALGNRPVEDFRVPDEISPVRASIEAGQTTSDKILADAAPPNE
jgi:penicillin-binding protein 1A